MLQLLIPPFFRSPASAESSKTNLNQSHTISSLDKRCVMLYNRIVYVSSFGFGSNYAFSEFHQQSADVGRIAFS